MMMFGARSGQMLNPQPPAPPAGPPELREYRFDDVDFFLSGQGLRMAKSNNDLWALSYDAVPDAADVEVVMRVALGAALDESYGLVVRGGGSAGSETGQIYWLNLGDGGDDGTFHQVLDSGAEDSTYFFAETPSQSARMWVRLQASGSQIRARSWLDGLDEPTNWTFERGDEGLSAAGWCGLVVRPASGGNRYFDYFAAGVDGAAAPMPGETIGNDQYATDFAGVDPLAAWTERWAAAGALEVVTTAADILPLGWNRNITFEAATTAGVVGDRLEVAAGSNQHNNFYPIDQPAGTDDAEVLMRFRAVSTAGSTDRARAEIVMRDDPDMFRAYFAGVDHQSDLQEPTNVRFAVPFTETIASEEYTAFAWEMDAEWYLRARIEEFGLKLRLWPVGEDEPSVWHLEATDGNERFDAGFFGLSGRGDQGSPILQVDYYAIETGANTIPIPD